MNDLAESTIIGLFPLIDRLQRTGQVLGRQTIVPLAEIKLPQVAQMYDVLIDRLRNEKLAEGVRNNSYYPPPGAGRSTT